MMLCNTKSKPFYRFFDADFWKYSIFLQEDRNIVVFPSIKLEIDFRKRTGIKSAPVISLWLFFIYWSLMISYKEDAIIMYCINENDFNWFNK